MSEVESVNVLGVRVDNVDYDEALSLIDRLIESRGNHQIVTVNPEFIVTAQRDERFRGILNASSLSLPDGVGVVWASRVLGETLKERVTGVDMVERISGLANRRGYRVFLLGAEEGVARTAADELQARHEGLQVVGTYAGSPVPADEASIVSMVQIAQPHLLFVAYGAPEQDKWIARNLTRMNVPVAMGVGGAFDFIAGKTNRAPQALQELGLEWLHRLWHEPWRWRRMLALPEFILMVLKAAAVGVEPLPSQRQLSPLTRERPAVGRRRDPNVPGWWEEDGRDNDS